MPPEPKVVGSIPAECAKKLVIDIMRNYRLVKSLNDVEISDFVREIIN